LRLHATYWKLIAAFQYWYSLCPIARHAQLLDEPRLVSAKFKLNQHECAIWD
jgi:hypothetical protein